MFMKYLKQPIARRANLEDQCKGHFFEQRFYSGALLSSQAIIAALAYVDTNPIRAKISDNIESYPYTSIAYRLKHQKLSANGQHDFLRPITSGLKSAPSVIHITLADYVEHLDKLILPAKDLLPTSKWHSWRKRVAVLGRKQRAYGSIDEIRRWIDQRRMHLRELPLV